MKGFWFFSLSLSLNRHRPDPDDTESAVVPVVIAVNAHYCLHQVTVLESMQPRMSGPAVRTLVYTMLARSQGFVMAGKAIVVVGAGNFGKLYIYKVARQFGVKVDRSIVHFT